MTKESPTIFFQSSLPRSGSTLFQNLMAQNPDFYVTPTSGVLELVFAARHNYTESLEFKAQDQDLMQKAFKSFCQQGFLGYYKAITDKPYVIDKSRGWGYYQGFLNFFYPNPKIVCMIRDIRSIFSSLEKKYRLNIDKSGYLTDDSIMKGVSTEQRVVEWAQTQPLGLALERLRQIILEGNDKKMLFLKFEDLTRNPQNELNKFYDFVGLKSMEHDTLNVEQATIEDDAVYGIFGDHSIRPKVEPVEEDYNEILGYSVAEWIRNNYSWFYERFGY